jgi:hypothetical protein
MIENIDQFIDAFTESLKLGIFVKMTLGNYKGADKHLQKLLIRLVETKKGLRLFFSIAMRCATRRKITISMAACR